MGDEEFDYTLLTCTYNRADDLRQLLESAVGQERRGFRYEIVVVDNNSADDTRAVCNAFITRHPALVRYLFEPRQGKSYALNTGLAHIRGRVYSIADDDLVYPPDYLRKLHAVFAAHPDAAVVAGKVLPLWKSPPPPWLNERHWAAIAMADFGASPFETGRNNPVCLLAAAYRRTAVLAVNGYDPALGVSGIRLGGVEDAEIMTRLYNAGHTGVYCPDIEIFHKVEPRRMTRAYHLQWHRDHGRQYAIMRDEKLEVGNRRLLGVPGHLYTAAAKDIAGLAKATLRQKGDEAFWYETRLSFFAGFVQQRVSDLVNRRHSPE